MIRRSRFRSMPVAFGLMAAALVTLLSAVGVFSRPDRVFWDLYHRLSAGRRRPDPRILLVAVDKPSLDYFAAQGVLWPWPRDVWGYLVDLAAEAGARAVLFDIFFDDPGIDRLNSSGYHTDMYFAERLGGPFPTAIAADLSPDEPASKSVPTGLVWRGSPMPAHSMPGYGASLSHPRFQNAVMGLTNMTPDADGVIRCTPLAYAVGGRTLPTLALRGAQFLEGDGLTLPVLDRLGRMWLRYYGHGGREGVFPYLSAAALITGQYPPDSLRGETETTKVDDWRSHASSEA